MLASTVGMLAVPFYATPSANAATLREATLRLDRMKAATATSGTVCASARTVQTEADVQVTFPADFTVNGTASNWTVTTTNLPAGATAWPGIATATSVSGQTVTFPSNDLTVNTLYCFNFGATNTLTTGASGSNKRGSIVTRTSGPAVIDNKSYAVAVVTDDQIIITAVVPPTFSFALSATSDAFLADLNSSSVTSASGTSVTVGTNARNGWVTWMKSDNAALVSLGASASIATAGTVDDTPTDLASTTGYVVDVDITTDSANGTGTVSQAAGYGAEYAGANATSGGTLSSILQPIAASNGTTDGDILTLTARAKITALQEAGDDYTDTLTVVGAGRF